MNSNQEELVNLFSHTLTGAAAVFAPDCYGFSGKRKTDEPADLVWNYDNFVLLMYMTRTEKVLDQQDVLENKKRRQINHNLKQAKKWLNHWRINQVPLQGKNDHQSFNISFTENLQVVVVSVYEVGTNDGYIETNFALTNNVSMCVSLPESAIQLLAEMEATPADICWILTSLTRVGVPSPFDSRAIILNHFTKNALTISKSFMPMTSAEVVSSIASIKSIRQQCSSLVQSLKGDTVFVSVFNDLLFIEVEMIVNVLDNILLEHKRNYNMNKAVGIDLANYYVMIIVCNSDYKSESALKSAKVKASSLNKDLLIFTYCLYDVQGKYVVAALFEQERSSFITKMLQSVISDLKNYDSPSNAFRVEQSMFKTILKR